MSVWGGWVEGWVWSVPVGRHLMSLGCFWLQNEMEAMLSSASVNAELCKEIERLRHENEILKQQF